MKTLVTLITILISSSVMAGDIESCEMLADEVESECVAQKGISPDKCYDTYYEGTEVWAVCKGCFLKDNINYIEKCLGWRPQFGDLCFLKALFYFPNNEETAELCTFDE